ncbi:MAG TPA: glycoside hydrolase family 3 C-terminal domain-containing protein [Candidatus Binatia bacterium]|nr:glycoside hydrolase family 3 C-terminal domain-containing protein [Candidatus Binatia bacterium]
MAFRRRAALFLLVVLFIFPSSSRPETRSAQIESRVDSLLKQLTLEEKIDLLGGVDGFYTRDIPRVGLPRFKMADGPLGVRNYGPSTTLGGIALAATWDAELARRVGSVIGEDARARGVHFLLGPGVNIYRAPLCGRNFEYLGEDPFLASRIAVGYIEGLQGQGVSATIKHFVANNQEFDRHNMDSVVDERTLREIYLPTFETAVKEARVGAIMDSYNLTNEQHMSQNGLLNSDVVKKEWGFEGIVMSDWTSTYDGIAAANNGLDLEMPSAKFMNRDVLLPAVRSGEVSEATIDDKVRRLLRVAVRFGWLDREQTDLSIPKWNSEGNEVALEMARSGIVLLKNRDHLLPLDKTKIQAIAVIGPDAYPGHPTAGGSAEVKPFESISYLEGLANEVGKVKVYYDPGLPTLEEMAKRTEFRTAATRGERGLRTEFFGNSDFSGPPLASHIDRHVDFDPAHGPDGTYADTSARWSGYFIPSSAGRYVVFVQGPGENGGYRLYIDDKPIFDDWKASYAFVSTTHLDLSPSPHHVRLEYKSRNGWGKTKLNFGIVRADELVSTPAKSLAKHADAVVLAIGFDAAMEGEASDRTFALPPGQDELASEIAALNKSTIVAVTSGGGVDMTAWVDQVPAIFESWYSGQQSGTALAELIFGDANPSGRLPISIERRWEDNAVHDSYYPKKGENKINYSEGVFVGYRHFDKAGIKPLFPFGYGLSYTSFSYKNLSIFPAKLSGDEKITVSFDITNTGEVAGADAAQVYVADHHSHLPRPVKELKGFAKPTLQPGETRHVTIQLDRRAFSYYDADHRRWTVDPGDFEIDVARSSAQVELTGNVTVH